MSLTTAVAVSVFAASASPLDALEAKLKSAKPEEKWTVGLTVQKQALDLVQKDKLKTPAELGRAVKLIMRIDQFQLAQAAYELSLSAMIGGDTPSRDFLATAWDNLMVSASRPRRIGAQNISPIHGAERFKIVPTYPLLVENWKNPKAMIDRATNATDNAEMKAIVDADQKAREGLIGSHTSPEAIEKMIEQDFARLKRTKEIVAEGKLTTANDYFNAGLVCQHGVMFEDYALAHELAVCGSILGHKSAAWLSGASYDRMLVNSGYPQRFGTQYSANAGEKFSLSRFDPQWINDTERKLVVKLTLKQSQNRKLN